MTGDFDFGSLRKDTTDAKSTPKRTTTPRDEITPTKSDRKRTDWKKKYEDLEAETRLTDVKVGNLVKGLEIGKKAFDKLTKAFDTLQETDKVAYQALLKKYENIKQEMFEKRDQYEKELLDLAGQLGRYQFSPKKFSDLSQLLISMRVRGNRAQQDTVKRIVGTTDIAEVRKYIFDILEAPHNE